MVQLAPILLGGVNAPSAPYENTTATTSETGSGSALPVLTPNTGIMEELTLQIIGQFFVTMKYCIKFVLFGRSLFKFVRSLLENKIENIRQTGGSGRAIVYRALVELLGTCSRDLKSLERANQVVDAQRVSKDLCIKQEQEQREIEERIAECTCQIDTFRISYQG